MKNKKFILSISFALGIFIAGLLLDLLSKHYVIQVLPNVGDSMDVIPGFINFIHVQNSGAAWGIFEGRSIFLIIVSILILGIYIWFYALRLKKLRNASSITLGISVGFIAGGCIGNLVDRIALGYVRDFINFEFMEFPVFNVADICLTVGIILMIIYFIFLYSKEDKKLATITVQIEKFRDTTEIDQIDASTMQTKSQENSEKLDDEKNQKAEDKIEDESESAQQPKSDSGEDDER